MIWKNARAIKSVNDAAAVLDSATALARVRKNIEKFAIGNAAQVSGLPLLSRACYLNAHKARSDTTEVSAIDWDAWRLGLEYALLDIQYGRNERAATILSSPATVSRYLATAIGLELTDRAELAKKVLTSVAPVLGDTVKRLPKDADLTVFGHCYEIILSGPPPHARLGQGGPIDRKAFDAALLARDSYAHPSGEAGALLPAPEGDLVPVELIYLNTKLSTDQQNPDLTLMAQKISATGYPDDPDFQDIDIALATL